MKTNFGTEKLIGSLTVGLMFLSGCGPNASVKSSSNTGTSDQASNVVQAASRDISECSKSKASDQIEFQLMAVKSSQGVVDPNRVRIKITKIPSEFKTSNMELVIFKRFRIPVGATEGTDVLGESKLGFKFEKRVYGGFTDLVANQGVFKQLNYNGYEVDSKIYAGVSHLSQQANLSTNEAITFFQTAVLNVDLADVQGEYKALRIALYKDGALYAESDALIPAIHANPNVYKSVRDIASLIDLHPFKDGIGSTMDDAQWLNAAQAFCF